MTPSQGFLAEIKDAVTTRAALLVLGVLVLQLAFITSYIGAFHHPKPSEIPIAVTAPAAQVAERSAQQLGALPGDPLDPRVVEGEAAALAQVRNRDVDGALIIDPAGRTDRLLVASGAGASLSQALEEVVGAAERAQGRTVRVTDVAPAAKGDSRGLSSFYLVIGWCVGGYLCAAILAISAGARPANPHRAVIRLGALLVYAVAAGLLGAVIAGPVLDALPGSIWGLWGLGTLVVFAVGAITLAFQGLAGVIGIGLAILLVVVLGNPSAGGAYPYPLLPPFWSTIGPALPPGAGTYAARSITYFNGNGAGGPMLVLSAWALVGAAVTLACATLRRTPRTPTAP
ncbi:DUF3533 domain-containing protein [Streptomyces sp. A0592]|uniref:DUF3533 domain-containing protein n=1 Tax=Streptomyces sp. A0592 TaxID=2563099 RepID=UPI00109E7C48|nr:DUF3533 domain-containing protein [Streptomyces sp. A0592]THA80023.1 DUF3533 domain-containing protein [Streptomyces sp. A0592]